MLDRVLIIFPHPSLSVSHLSMNRQAHAEKTMKANEIMHQET